MDNDSHPSYFNSLFKKVDTTKNQGMDQAILSMDSAFYAFPNPGAVDSYERYFRKWNYYSYIKRNYFTAAVYADSMIMQVADRAGEERFAELYTRALLLKGDCFVKLKRYTEAFVYFSQGRQIILKRLKNKCTLAEYLGNIGNLIFAQGKYRLAAGYYAQQYDEQSNCGEDTYWRFKILQGALDNAGICYFRIGMTDSASWYFDKALKVIEKNEPKFPADYFFTNVAKGVVYGNQADVLDKRNRFADAEILYKKSITATEPGDIEYTQSTQVRLARMYLKNNEMQKAGMLLDDIKTSLDTLANELDLKHWFKLKSDYYTKQHEIEPAKKYLQLYLNIKEAAATRDKEFSGINVKLEFENIERQYNNDILEKENGSKTVYLIIAIIVSVMGIVIILLVWYYLRLNGRHIRQLKELNQQVKQKNNDLQKAFKLLEQSHSENNRIMKIVAHDLRNPVSAINQSVNLLLKQKHPDSTHEMLELIKAACDGSMSLIKELFQNKKKHSAVKKEPVDMARLLEYCIELLQTKADEKKQRLVLDAEHMVVKLNRQRIWRVVSNIVNNAIKFSPENALIHIKLKKKNGTVLLSVKDNGIGIPGYLKEKIFTMSPEVSRAGTFGEESYGLGLSISQKIVEEHEGKIWFDSTDGEGTIFYVELPNMHTEVV